MRSISAAVAAILMTAASANGQDVQDQVSFTKNVAPILQERCQSCHRPGTFAPMPLVTYEETRPWARSIKAKVIAREMTPWFIDKNVGIQHFSNDVSLTDEEIAAIAKWVDSGAPKGNPADMPPPRQFDDDQTWHIGQPDHIVTLPKDLVVAAKGPDKWPEIVVDSGLTEDRYIKGVQIMPIKGFPVFHHIITTIVNEDEDNEAEGVEGSFGGGFFLNEYALGKKGDVFPDGSARLIKAGTKINFQIHTHPTGKEIPANVALGMKFYPKGYVPNKVVASNLLGNSPELDIRPNTDNIRTDTYTTMTKPARLLSYQPHMHNRGKAACLEAIYPGGRTEIRRLTATEALRRHVKTRVRETPSAARVGSVHCRHQAPRKPLPFCGTEPLSVSKTGSPGR